MMIAMTRFRLHLFKVSTSPLRSGNRDVEYAYVPKAESGNLCASIQREHCAVVTHSDLYRA